MISLAGRRTFDVAAATCAIYSYAHPETVRIYDLGASEIRPRGPRELSSVTLSDVGRLVAIDGELAAGDVATLLDLSPTLARLAIEPDADLGAADPAEFGGLYDRMQQLWDAFTVHDNIKWTKTSKLLHLKWPNAFPLLDGWVREYYRGAAEAALQQYPQRALPRVRRLYWVAIRAALIAARPDLEQVRVTLVHRSDWGRTLARLSDLRLLDLLVWHASRHGPRLAAERAACGAAPVDGAKVVAIRRGRSDRPHLAGQRGTD